MKKIAIYLIPGLAAGPEIFENLKFSKDSYEVRHLQWKTPIAIDENISEYAMRMCEDVKAKKPVLIGVSFGGIMAQEMGKYLDAKKVIIISSVKHHYELPKRFQMMKFTKAYKLFPAKIIANIEEYEKYFFGKSLKKRVHVYKKYLSVRNPLYLNWSINAMVQWEQKENNKNRVHIHGTKDQVFPIKNIENCIKVLGGSHVMIITKAKKLSKIIEGILTS
ncbi:alpha/beta hydrolase [Polaribacter sp.]|nr:alpha/beta hydrolase [Polaribacter sp.]